MMQRAVRIQDAGPVEGKQATGICVVVMGTESGGGNGLWVVAY